MRYRSIRHRRGYREAGGHRRPASRWALAVVALTAALAAQATTYSVGPGAGCTHATVAGALAAATVDAGTGPHLVKIVQGTYAVSNLAIINPVRDIRIEGGYFSCTASGPGTGLRSILDANDVNGTRVLGIANWPNTLPRRFVDLRQLTLTGGHHSGSLGAGLHVTGRVDVQLQWETYVEGNVAQNGGGIALVNETADPALKTRLYITTGSRVCNNQALGPGDHGNGGGIHAAGGAIVTIYDGLICDNTARRHGGGLFLASQNDALVFDPPFAGQTVSFIDNRAGAASFVATEGFGGAIYTHRAPISYESGQTPANERSLRLIGNTANFGGAIYADGAAGASDPFTAIELRNIEARLNLARGQGGAFFLHNAVDLRVLKWGQGPCPDEDLLFCNDIWANYAENESFPNFLGAGGVAFLDHAAGAQRPVLRVAGALFGANTDVNGTAAIVDARGAGEVRILRSLFWGNTAGGDAGTRAMMGSNANTLFAYNTVADNNVARLFYQAGGTTLNATGSILYAPGTSLIAGGGNMTHGGCLLAHTTSGIPAANVKVGPPGLGWDFAPKPRSLAADTCDLAVGDVFYSGSIDAFGRPVPYDIAGVENQPFGSYDLGAVEQRDVVFYGGFGTRPDH